MVNIQSYTLSFAWVYCAFGLGLCICVEVIICSLVCLQRFDRGIVAGDLRLSAQNWFLFRYHCGSLGVDLQKGRRDGSMHNQQQWPCFKWNISVHSTTNTYKKQHNNRGFSLQAKYPPKKVIFGFCRECKFV